MLSLVLVALSISLALFPGSLPGISTYTNLVQSQNQLFLILTIFAGFLYSLVRVKPSKDSESDFLPPNFSPEEVQVADDQKILGDNIENMIDNKETEKLRKRLQDDLKDVLRQSRDYSAEEISDAVETGSWTEDRDASAFLSEEQDFSIKERLLGLIYENRTEKRLEKTLEAMNKTYYQRGQERT